MPDYSKTPRNQTGKDSGSSRRDECNERASGSEDSIRKERDEMPMIAISVIASAITTKIVATYYFKKIDGYVEEMCEITEKNNKLIQTILHKLYGSS